MQTVIIEDEEKSLQVVRDFIEQFAPDLKLAGTAGSVAKSIQLIETVIPHLVLMDIRISDGTGFDVLQQLSSRNFELICITAYDNYALQAFRFSAIDYLLKPVGIPEFTETVGRAVKRIKEKTRHQHIEALLHNLTQQSTQDRKIGVSTITGFEFIDLSDIIWCNSEGSYTTFHLVNRIKLVSSRNIGFYEDLLCANNFCRIHHNSIINLRYVKSYIKGKNGYVVMTSGDRLEISQRRKGDFLDNF
jgi:two-component system LytT family response regulator